jgi:integrase
VSKFIKGQRSIAGALKQPGRHPVARVRNLYLEVGDNEAGSWVARYMLDGRSREMGFGSVFDVTLAEATDEWDKYRKVLKRERIDPIDHRLAEQARKRLEAAKQKSFKDLAVEVITINKDGWSAKNLKAWQRSLERYAYPLLATLHVRDIDRVLVKDVLLPLWTDKPTAAEALRQKLALIFDSAIAQQLHEAPNPASTEALKPLLPKTERRTVHREALDYDALPGFMVKLAAADLDDKVAAEALAFTILTASRSEESLPAKWTDIDMVGQCWTIPPEAIKGRREHKVPLSEPALAILRRMSEQRNGPYIFHREDGRRLPHDRMRVLLPKLGVEASVHGFRSTFRDYCGDKLNVDREVIEFALHHVVGDAAEQSYRRKSSYEKRVRLMRVWGEFAMNPKPAAEEGGTVVPIRA